MDTKSLQRFMAKVKITEGCWFWIGAKHELGYGVFWEGGRLHGAHRVAFAHWRFPCPADKELDHLCRVPACVNPAHLEPVSHAENVGRSRKSNKTHCKHGHSLEDCYIQFRPHVKTGRKSSRKCRICAAIHRKNQLARARLLKLSQGNSEDPSS